MLEQQHGGMAGFGRACVAAAWLEYRNLRYYPSNLLLAAAQELTAVGVWYFVGRFLSAAADRQVQVYGGNYLAYVLVGVLFNQVGMAALKGPFQTISEAFWDKRLETYRLSIHGIWANVAGRLLWEIVFSTVLQLLALALLLTAGGLRIVVGWNLLLVLLTYALLLAANAGLGFAGASLFFLLEVKTGQDPITWSYHYLVMIASGLYVPLAALPGWLRGLGAALPQTYGFAAARALLLAGAGWDAPQVGPNILSLAILAAVTLSVGCAMLNLALRRAERRGGIGVVV
jgi:ABC-2 type transport system permease protein